MTFTNEQMERLAKYDKFFETAIRSRYARYPGAAGVATIHEIYSSVAKNIPKLNASCSTCIFRLLTDCGAIYFKDKEEMQKAERQPKRKKK
jgi:hypothetical protein